MLDSLKAMVLKRSPVTPAERQLEVIEQGAKDRDARLAAEEKAAREAALQVKRDALAKVDAEINALLDEKHILQTRIKGKLCNLLPDLTRLDAVEQQGTRLSSQAFSMELACGGGELRSSWRDPKLSGVSTLIHQWYRRLEG